VLNPIIDIKVNVRSEFLAGECGEIDYYRWHQFYFYEN